MSVLQDIYNAAETMLINDGYFQSVNQIDKAKQSYPSIVMIFDSMERSDDYATSTQAFTFNVKVIFTISIKLNTALTETSNYIDGHKELLVATDRLNQIFGQTRGTLIEGYGIKLMDCIGYKEYKDPASDQAVPGWFDVEWEFIYSQDRNDTSIPAI